MRRESHAGTETQKIEEQSYDSHGDPTAMRQEKR